jgi:hypothetical protein
LKEGVALSKPQIALGSLDSKVEIIIRVYFAVVKANRGYSVWILSPARSARSGLIIHW